MPEHEEDKRPEAGSPEEGKEGGEQPEKGAGEPHRHPNPEKDKPADKPESKPLDPDVKDNRLMAALCYINLLFLVPLLARNRSDYALFHCRQGIIVFAIQAIFSFVAWIPGVGPFLYLLLLAISVIGFVQAWRGEWWEIPLLGKYAKMLKL